MSLEESDHKSATFADLRVYRHIVRLIKFIIPFVFALTCSVGVASAYSLETYKKDALVILDRTEAGYGQLITAVASLQNYDKNFITAVIVVESEGNSNATSKQGAQGLMQIMPATARAMGITDTYEPFQNIWAGTKYLKALEDHFGLRSKEDMLLAYNMGPQRAKRWKAETGKSAKDWRYVQKVMYVYRVLEKRDQEELLNKSEEATLLSRLFISPFDHSYGIHSSYLTSRRATVTNR